MTKNVVDHNSNPAARWLNGTKVFTLLLFLLPVVALNLRKGVGLIEVMVLVGAICYALPLWRRRKELFGPARYIILAFAFSLASATASLLRDELTMSWIDNSIRQLVIAALIGLIVLTRPKVTWFWKGLIVGCLGVAAIAICQRFILHMARAEGFHMAILFGDISMTMGLMALVSIPFFSRTRWSLLPWIAFGCGVLASILSGARGGWAAILLAAIPLYLYRSHWIGRKQWISIGICGVMLACIFCVPQFGVAKRMAEVSTDINQYLDGNSNSSSGARLEMWHGAWMLVDEHPLLGVGRPKFNEGLKSLIDQGKLNPSVGIYRHAHNEFLNALATEGAVGAIALLGLYLAPLVFFIRVAKKGLAARPYAVAGVLLVLSFVHYGMTQVMFAHHVGVAFYALMVTALAGICIASESADKVQAGRPLV